MPENLASDSLLDCTVDVQPTPNGGATVVLRLSAEEHRMLREVARATGVGIPTFLRFHLHSQYLALRVLRQLRAVGG